MHLHHHRRSRLVLLDVKMCRLQNPSKPRSFYLEPAQQDTPVRQKVGLRSESELTVEKGRKHTVADELGVESLGRSSVGVVCETTIST